MSTPKTLVEAIEDIGTYLETMPAKTDDWSIGYEAITPYVKSLKVVFAEFKRLREITLRPEEAGRCDADHTPECATSQRECFCGADSINAKLRLLSGSGQQ